MKRLKSRVRISHSLRRRREKKARADVQASIPMPDEKFALRFNHHEPPTFVAVCKDGYGVDQIPALAIARAQTHVNARSSPSQMLIYESPTFIEPTGFDNGAPTWANGTKPRLVGLTTTHQLFKQSPR